ncbi:FAD-dependent monooxygenase, partial [Gammaproteobacteria bacterium]|nr:FAD-dependent monooxygenase [Gammaproteobacteria bacterium]
MEQPVGVSAMGWPNQVLFYQPELEGFIRASVEAESNIVIKEGTELLSFDDTAEGVTLNCKNSDGDLSFISKYLVGCDGASSFVRRELNVDLEDFEYN